MDGKQEFKDFVRDNPRLIKYVKNGEKTWQDFYEIFHLYGNNSDVWKDYLNSNSDNKTGVSESMDLLSWIKAIDLDSIQNGIASIQRVLGVVSDLSNKDNNLPKEDYKPRPLYKHFED